MAVSTPLLKGLHRGPPLSSSMFHASIFTSQFSMEPLTRSSCHGAS